MNYSLGDLASPFISRKMLFWANLFYTLLLLSANFVGDRSFQIFHFSYSAGTFVMQLVFCAIIVFSEIIPLQKIVVLIWKTALINLIAALIAYLALDFPVPTFWLNQEEGISLWGKFNVIFFLTVAYICSTLVMVFIAALLRMFFGQGWLLLRVLLILTVGFIIDSAILLPILYFVCADRYMALWKMISLASVKCLLSLVFFPLTYLTIYFLKKQMSNAN